MERYKLIPHYFVPICLDHTVSSQFMKQESRAVVRKPRDAAAIFQYGGRLAVAILDLIEPEIASFDPPTTKTLYPRTKREVDRMTSCGVMAIRNSTYHEGGYDLPQNVGPKSFGTPH